MSPRCRRACVPNSGVLTQIPVMARETMLPPSPRSGVSLDGVFEEARFFNVEALVEILAPATRPDFASRPDFVVAKVRGRA